MVAVLLVMSSHPSIVDFSKGYLGADVFFVITEYLMLRLIDAGYTKKVPSNKALGSFSLSEFHFRAETHIFPMSLRKLVVKSWTFHR